MRLLFDHGVPSPLRRLLQAHSITLAREMGWEEYVNGRLIAAAEAEGFEALVTCDRNWIYQQNLAARTIAIVVISTNLWPHIEPHVATIETAIGRAGQGSYEEVSIPRRPLLRRPPPIRL